MAHLFFLNETTSTNDELPHYFTLSHSENVAVYTFNQTKGKGQYGNSWESSPNLNLAFSYGLKVKDISLPHSLFNFHTAVICRDFLAKLTQNDVKIKWPNDLIIKNKKVAGILIEKRKVDSVKVYIIGIGINVLQQNFENLPKAGSLFTQCGKEFNLKFMAESLLIYFSENLIKTPNQVQILKTFNENLFRKDEISVFEIKGNRQNGIIKSADENGFLEIELENDGLKKFYHKEIEMLY